MNRVAHPALSSGALREIVDRAVGSQERQRKKRRRYEQRRPSHLLRRLLGFVLYAGGLGAISYAIVRMLHIGTCASGPSPYVIGRECPSDTGWLGGLFAGSAFACLIGGAMLGAGLALPMGLGFVVMGGALLYGGVTAPSSAAGAALAGYTVGGVFVVMGLVFIAAGIWARASSCKDTAPTLTAVGLAALIGATAPRPAAGAPPSNDDPGKEGSGWDS
jgi:hypothetical protein